MAEASETIATSTRRVEPSFGITNFTNTSENDPRSIIRERVWKLFADRNPKKGVERMAQGLVLAAMFGTATPHAARAPEKIEVTPQTTTGVIDEPSYLTDGIPVPLGAPENSPEKPPRDEMMGQTLTVSLPTEEAPHEVSQPSETTSQKGESIDASVLQFIQDSHQTEAQNTQPTGTGQTRENPVMLNKSEGMNDPYNLAVTAKVQMEKQSKGFLGRLFGGLRGNK